MENFDQEVKRITNEATGDPDTLNAIDILQNNLNTAKENDPQTYPHLVDAVTNEIIEQFHAPEFAHAWANKNFDTIQSTEVQGTDTVDKPETLSKEELARAKESGKFNSMEEFFLFYLHNDYDFVRNANIDNQDEEVTRNDLIQGMKMRSDHSNLAYFVNKSGAQSVNAQLGRRLLEAYAYGDVQEMAFAEVRPGDTWKKIAERTLNGAPDGATVETHSAFLKSLNGYSEPVPGTRIRLLSEDLAQEILKSRLEYIERATTSGFVDGHKNFNYSIEDGKLRIDEVTD